METESEQVTREVEIDAPVEDVWEAISTEDGRERWLEHDPDREIVIEHSDPNRRIAWWWWSGERDTPHHVDIRVTEVRCGTRVIVTETAPATVPLATMTASATAALAYA